MLKSLTVRSFRSLANVELRFKALTLLVGTNGSGKSNLVDALRFVADALSTSVAAAINTRGGLRAVRRVSLGHPRNFGFRLQLHIPREGEQDINAAYSFEIGAEAGDIGFSVLRERCVIHTESAQALSFETHNGLLIGGSFSETQLRQPDQLALPLVANVAPEPEFFYVLQELQSMRFYSPAPDRIRELQDPAEGDIFLPDGSNASSVIRELMRHNRADYEIICELLSKVVPGVESVTHRSIGNKETLEFHQSIGGKYPWKFAPGSMSDGTLRALAILLAVYQPSSTSLVAIEAPEATIHPAAAEVLVSILRVGSERSQVLVTTHSPDVIDSKSVSDSEIRVVEKIGGRTEVGPLGARSRDAIAKLLYSPGELLRVDELERGEVDKPQSALF